MENDAENTLRTRYPPCTHAGSHRTEASFAHFFLVGSHCLFSKLRSACRRASSRTEWPSPMKSFPPPELLDIYVVWLPHSHEGRSEEPCEDFVLCLFFPAYFLRREFQKGKHHSSKLWTLSADVNMLVMLPVCLWRSAKGRCLVPQIPETSWAQALPDPVMHLTLNTCSLSQGERTRAGNWFVGLWGQRGLGLPFPFSLLSQIFNIFCDVTATGAARSFECLLGLRVGGGG